MVLSISRKVGSFEYLKDRLLQSHSIKLCSALGSMLAMTWHVFIAISFQSFLFCSELQLSSPAATQGPDYAHWSNRFWDSSFSFALPFKGRWSAMYSSEVHADHRIPTNCSA